MPPADRRYNPFLQLTPARVRHALERLKPRCWRDPIPVPHQASFAAGPGGRRPHSGHWGKLFDRAEFTLRLPARRGLNRWLEWRDQAEGTLLIDGRPFYGFDVAHRHCRLPERVSTAVIRSVCIQSAIWHPDATGLDEAGSHCEGARLWARDEAAWQCYHDLLVLADLLDCELRASGYDPAVLIRRTGLKPALGAASVLLRTLLRRLDEALDAFDRGGVAGLLPRLASLLQEFRGSAAGRATLVGHSHVDLVWLWPEAVGVEKTVHATANVLYLTRHYDEFRFTTTQPAAWEAATQACAGLGPLLANAVRRGKVEPVGAAYVESDTQLPCGEALLRSFRLGQERIMRLTGSPSPLLWLPDCFGYTHCLPQIMAAAGVKYFFTNKATWSAITAFPHSSFRWRGLDGTEILAHILPEAHQFYNGLATVQEARDNLREHRQSDVHPEVLLPTGYGDGGGGPTAEMCERARRMRNLAGTPATNWGSATEFFRRLERRKTGLPVHTGEIYLQFHRGVFTTHARLKAAYRAAERALQTWEAASAATDREVAPAVWWERVIFAQFHDLITGTSIAEVYEAAIPELEALATRVQAAAAAKLAAAAPGSSPAFFNPCGHHVLIRRGSERRVLPAWSGLPWAAMAPAPAAPVPAARGGRIKSDRVSLMFDGPGRLSAFAIDGAEVAIDGRPGQPWVLADLPANFDAWDIDRSALGCISPAEWMGRPTLSADAGAARAVFRARHGASRLTLTYEVRTGEPFVRLRCEVDWQEKDALLRLAFPTAYRGSSARFGTPFGSVLRPQLGRNPEEEALWEVPASRWAVVLDDAQQDGLWLATERSYGFSCHEGLLTVSLVRSPRATGSGDRFSRVLPASLRRGPASRPVYTDQGSHSFELAFGRFQPGAPGWEMPPAIAEWAFTPPLAYAGGEVAAPVTGVVPSNNVQPAWILPGGDGVEVRWHETLGAGGHLTVGSRRLAVRPGQIVTQRFPG